MGPDPERCLCGITDPVRSGVPMVGRMQWLGVAAAHLPLLGESCCCSADGLLCGGPCICPAVHSRLTSWHVAGMVLLGIMPPFSPRLLGVDNAGSCSLLVTLSSRMGWHCECQPIFFVVILSRLCHLPSARITWPQMGQSPEGINPQTEFEGRDY